MEPEDATPINVVSVVQSTPSVAAETVQQLVDAAKEEAAKLRSSTEDACIDMPSPDKLKALMKEINATDSEQSTDEA
ncbi:MAG: hypothetical protein JSS66_06610 [Armatimonadetes bacterium]|nr:hypothetical protein [Armatimonadota bacterium]